MNVDVIPVFKEVIPQKIYGKTVIVLDIFRCTSSIVTALANGCTEVIPAISPEDARVIVEKRPRSSYLLAGEIKGLKVPGFDMGNSPSEFSPAVVKNKSVVISTTNGSAAIRACRPAKHVIIGSFLNVNPACCMAAAYQKDIVIVCAGVQGNIALEDIMAAGCFITTLKDMQQELKFSDLTRTFYYLYKYFRNSLHQILATSRSGLRLSKLGLEKDIAFCLQENIYKTVPIFKNNSVRSGLTLISPTDHS